MAYPFTDGRVVANLGPTSFRRQVIASDNVQVGLTGLVGARATVPAAFPREALGARCRLTRRALATGPQP